MTSVLKLIRNQYSPAQVKAKIKCGEFHPTSLFKARKACKGKSLYEHLKKYRKFKKWTLEDFAAAGAIDYEAEDSQGYTLIKRLIIDQDIENLKKLLLHGVKLKHEDYVLAKGEMRKFFDYRPGKNQPSIFEFCSKEIRKKDYINRLRAIIYDQADTTEDDSSEADAFSADDFSDGEEDEFKKLRRKKLRETDQSSLRLVAARGVHFSPKHFKSTQIQKVKQSLEQKHPTFSQSTLFGAGYSAADDVDEEDSKIKKRHKQNLKFVTRLKESEDHKEKKIGKTKPCVTRNKQEFENLYYRYMQVYISNYNRLFSVGSIKVDFGFDSKYNPEVSASWNFCKAAMYASGYRFDWKKNKLRKDPHYRRFTGKAKHPHIGYLDVYVFDVEFVRTHGFDRQLMCKDDLIKLSQFYRHEAEIIFHSMIPSKYHSRRCILSLPSFDVCYAENRNLFFQQGIRTKLSYKNFKEQVLSLPERKRTEEYRNFVDSVTEIASKAQATLIEKTIHYRLYASKKPKFVVHDHGSELKLDPFKF